MYWFFFQSADHRDIMNLVNAYEHFLGRYIIHATFIWFDRNCKYPKKSLLYDVDSVNGFREKHSIFCGLVDKSKWLKHKNFADRTIIENGCSNRTRCEHEWTMHCFCKTKLLFNPISVRLLQLTKSLWVMGSHLTFV